MVTFLDTATNQEISFHIDKKVLRLLDHKVKPCIQKNDKDYVLLCDGYEGSGKSTMMQQLGKYVDPSLTLDRICMTANEFKKAVNNAQKGQCVIYDEAVTGLSSGETITRIGKLLKSMMMQMRQKNLFVIVIIPTLFELNKYAVLSRAKFLFHTFESKDKMGYAIGFNKKQMRQLYLKGRKTYSYTVYSSFKARFYGKYVVDELEYRKKKGTALFEIDQENNGEIKEDKFTQQRNVCFKMFQEIGYTPDLISAKLLTYGIKIEPTTIEMALVRLNAVEPNKLSFISPIISL